MNAVCVSWDFRAAGTGEIWHIHTLSSSNTTGGHGNWTDRGCETVFTPGSDTVFCNCSHLTNFAALVVRLHVHKFI